VAKAPRTVIDVRCTLKKMGQELAATHPGTPLWHLPLEAFIQWLRWRRQQGWRNNSLAKCLSHARGLLDYAWRMGQAERNVLDGFDLADDGRRRQWQPPTRVHWHWFPARLNARCFVASSNGGGDVPGSP
jgi:hypothetical protein